MSKITIEAVVIEALRGGKFRGEGEDHALIAYLSGKIRNNKIKIEVGDTVIVELSPYDLSNGRIIRRL